MFAKNFLIILLPVIFTQITIAQTKVIRGRVTDRENADGVPHASVVAKEFQTGTQTDSNGYFQLSVPVRANTIVVSSEGYQSKVVDISNLNNINVTLNAGSSSLDEVLVIGYGMTKRKDVTGAVTKISDQDFTRGIIGNPLQQVQGKIAGMVVTQAGSDPNGDFTVRIRGATSIEGQPPLLVIDGVAIDDFHKAITTLNPADIASYDVLKDASAAAIYGARGANGVIIVTTKSARSGKTMITYDGNVSVATLARKIAVLNAAEWRKATGSNGAPLDKNANTDWQKTVTRTGLSHSHSVAISGGSDQFNFRGSAGYTRQQGIVLNTGNEIFTSRLSASQFALDNRLTIRYDINSSSIKRDLLPDQSSTSQVRNAGTSLFEFVLQSLPVIPAFNDDGTYFETADPSRPTPIKYLNKVYSKRTENFIQSAVRADYEVMNGLKAGVRGALSKANDVYDFFNSNLVNSIASKSNFNKRVFTGDMHVNYSRQLQKHHLDLLGTYEYNSFLNDGFAVLASGFLVPELLNNNLGAATAVQTGDISSYKNEVKLISFLARAIYSFDERYIATFNFRRDGSSKFGANNRWGNFPSVAVAWRISNEKFIHAPWLTDLKLRMSYGFTGNQENLPPDSYQRLYGPAAAYLYNGQFLRSYAIKQENNPDLKWEVRKSFNVGLDMSMLSDRINATIDVFSDKTSDILFLYGLPQPPFLTNSVYANAANATNRGVEATVGSRIISNTSFEWSAQAIFTVVRNKITNLSRKFRGADPTVSHDYGSAIGSGLSGAYVTQLQVGYPAGVFFVPQHVGFDEQGHELYNSYDDNGKLIDTTTSFSNKDKVFIDPTARFTWAFTNSFSYKNIDLNFMFRGVQGQKVFANSLLNLGSKVYLPSLNVSTDALKNGFTEQPQPTDYWIKNGSFARLEHLTIGYTFRRPARIQSLKIYATATNLFVITAYKGSDPEIRVEGSQRYIDVDFYPKMRTISIGAKLEL